MAAASQPAAEGRCEDERGEHGGLDEPGPAQLGRADADQPQRRVVVGDRAPAAPAARGQREEAEPDRRDQSCAAYAVLGALLGTEAAPGRVQRLGRSGSGVAQPVDHLVGRVRAGQDENLDGRDRPRGARDCDGQVPEQAGTLDQRERGPGADRLHGTGLAADVVHLGAAAAVVRVTRDQHRLGRGGRGRPRHLPGRDVHGAGAAEHAVLPGPALGEQVGAAQRQTDHLDGHGRRQPQRDAGQRAVLDLGPGHGAPRRRQGPRPS